MVGGVRLIGELPSLKRLCCSNVSSFDFKLHCTCVFPLKVLVQTILVQRSKFHDFQFLRCVAIKPSTPEFGGFNTTLTQIQRHGLKPRMKAMYTPLINMTPSESTII